VGKPQVRVFVLGARGESSLPPHVWEQLGFLFPAANFHVLFIGPQVALPRSTPASHSPPTENPSQPTSPEPEAVTAEASSNKDELPSETPEAQSTQIEEKPLYPPNVYTPPTPAAIPPLKWTRSSLARYGVPSYTTPYSYQISFSGLQVANYADVHHLFEETLDPYSDVFFFFSPGFGFPSPVSKNEAGEPILQISSPTEWGPVLPMLLASKCPIFVTGFSPADVERDVRSLTTAPGVADEFEWVVTPGPNPFSSEKWEVAEFDPRIMVKTNWGIWAIRGKSRDIQERSFFSNLLNFSGN